MREGATQLGPLERANLNERSRLARLRGQKQIQFLKRRVFYFLEYRATEKSQNPLILCVIHHRQNPLESTHSTIINYFPLYVSQ
jgi:hypothetical protein